MRRAYGKYLLIPFLSLLLFGCALTQLDTYNKRAYAAELAINQVLSDIETLKSQDAFTDAQWKRVQEGVRRVRFARMALHAAITYQQDPTQALSEVDRALTFLRPLLIRDKQP